MRLLYLTLAFFPLVLAKDLGIRFSKVLIDPRYNTSDIDLPLTSKHYPINRQTYQWLRNQIATSVLIRNVCLECYWGFTDLVEAAGGYPSHPSTRETSPYWAELAYVVEMQYLRRQNVDPKEIMPLPDAWMNFTIKDVAEAVHDEFLGIYHINLLSKWDKEKIVKIDRGIIPSTSNVDFLRSQVMLADLVTWAIARVGPSNFLLKWYVGMARPEEIVYKIATGEITKGPPASLVEDIAALNLQSATEFTAYPEGSPKHPSWPAMHSASSSASLWMSVVMDLSPQQYCQVLKTDYAISFARTVAGVHYVSDNMAGLNLAQELIARLLPHYLNEKYGSSKRAVREKIALWRFDWNDFMDSDCALGFV
ncbi:hypothetical protein MHU86_23417 [Fragilaria crotonensis]|nr:hypothetical protein MHU86_23417 [Fragilaria crotonensis]